MRGRGNSMRGRGAPENFSRGRGGQGRQFGRAQWGTALDKNKTNSARRLMRDYLELVEASGDPKALFVGVSAKPLPDDMYTWHGNIKAPDDTPWKGGVFHFQMNIPSDYPCSPPSITLYTPLNHPNVFGTTLCLDMLQATGVIYAGWVSAYTIETVLIQLQSFLFQNVTMNNVELKLSEENVRMANDFTCSLCHHKGPLSADPPLPKLEEQDFVMVKTPQQLLKEEFLCFQTKVPLRENTLGIGLSIRKSARTGKISHANSTMDLMSMRSFTKLKVRKSLEGVKFTHWFPLYFGETETYKIESKEYDEKTQEMVQNEKTVNTQERFNKHLVNSMSYLSKGNHNKAFDHEDVLEFMPKLIMTHVADMMNEKRHTSVLAIRRLVNYVRIFQYFIDLDPKISEVMEAKLEEFINDPSKRIKLDNVLPNLGNIQIYALMSKKFKFSDIIEAYLEEQLDRQVLWMLRELPQLDFEDKAQKKKVPVTEEQRTKVSWNAAKTGFYLTLFFFHLNNTLAKVSGSEIKDLVKVSQVVDQNYGCLDRDLENQFQADIQSIIKTDDFQKYYKIIGIQITESQLYEKLIQAVKNSRTKGYHGSCDDYDHKNFLPQVNEQSELRLISMVETFADVKYEKQEQMSIKTGGGEEELEVDGVKYTYKSVALKDSFKNADDKKWKQLCLENFDFVRKSLECQKDTTITAAKFATKHDNDMLDANPRKEKIVLQEDKLLVQKRNLLGEEKTSQLKKIQLEDDYKTGFTYKKLALKLVLEMLIEDLQYSLNFGLIYEFIKAFGDEIETLKLSIIDKTSLKSNHYWLMAIIPKMKNLKTLKIYKDNYGLSFQKDGFKFLSKAMDYFQKNGSSLAKIQFNNVLNGANSSDLLYQSLKHLPEIQILNFSENTLSVDDCKAIGKVLSEFKNVRELDLTNTKIQKIHGKEIADGLMRAKQLEILKIAQNGNLDCYQILYNLAFSPKIRHIDMTASRAASSDIAEALYKIMKISGSIQTMLIGDTEIAKFLAGDFYNALGENKTIETLVIDYPDATHLNKSRHDPTLLSLLAQACAMNSRKKGSLHTVSFRNSVSSTIILETFLSGFYISDKQHEDWYGDAKIAKEMKLQELTPKLHCGLKYLDIRGSSLSQCLFKMKNFEIKVDPVWPKFIDMMAKTNIQVLNVSQCNIDMKSIELYACSIGKNPVGPCKSLKILNLSRNKITKEGAKLLAPALEENKSIEYLDLSQNRLGVYGMQLIAQSLKKNQTLKGLNLFKNIIDVDGARALRELLKVNKSLEFLDIGHNRIRAKGLEAITEGIVKGNCPLKSLGLRMNFINDDGFQSFFDEVILSKISKIENLYLSQNNFSQYKADKLNQKMKEENLKIYVDQFESMLYQNAERMKKTMWFGPVDAAHIQGTVSQLRQSFFHTKTGCGLIKSIRIRKGKKINGKLTPSSNYIFVEFENEKQMGKVARLMYKGRINITRKGYLAGSNTFVQIRRSKRR